MPVRLCHHPGCSELIERGAECPAHPRKTWKRTPANRISPRKRGYDASWERLRAAHLAKEPFCREHGKRGRVVRATVVDHIIPHRGDQKLLRDPSNLQSLCAPCHRSKSAREGREMQGRGVANL